MGQAALKLVQRRRRNQSKYRDVFNGQRARAEMALERAGHYGIKVRRTRATIGEPFEHARLREVLLTYRYGQPIYLPLDHAGIKGYPGLEMFAKAARIRRMTSELVYEELMAFAKVWRRRRAPVRHRVWKDK